MAAVLKKATGVLKADAPKGAEAPRPAETPAPRRSDGEPIRRRRDVLSSFYRAPPAAGTSDPLDINGSSFNPDAYLQKLYRQHDLGELMRKEDEFSQQMRVSNTSLFYLSLLGIRADFRMIHHMAFICLFFRRSMGTCKPLFMTTTTSLSAQQRPFVR